MKHLRQLCVAVVLTLVFAFHAFAGEMDTPLAPPPPPATTLGEMDTPVAPKDEASNSTPTYANQLVFAVEDMMQTILLVF